MTNKQLHHLLKIWQPRLRLVDYDLNIKFCKPAEMYNKDAQGELYNFPLEMRAEVRIDPECEDIEHTVVHELLHCWLPWEWKGRDERREVAVNVLAYCFLTAYGRTAF
jgi:hypothetical protein